MAVRFVLASFMNGQVLMEDLPVDRGSDKTEVNIVDGGFSEIELPWRALPAATRNTWATYFKPFTKMIAVVDDALPYNHPSAVLFSGFVSKVDKSARDGIIRIQTAPMNEYLAARAATRVWGEPWTRDNSADIEEADEPRYKAATWEELVRYIVGKCFEPSPAGARQPPSTLRSGTVATTTGDAVSIPDEFDGTTYLDLLMQIRDEESGNGLEWRFVPAWGDAAKTTIVFDLVVGSAASPHLGENATINVELSGTSEHKISTFTSAFDSTEFYNKVYLRYQNITATDTDVADDHVRAAWAAPNGDEVPLVDKFVLTNQQLTETQVEALANAHVVDGQTGGLEVGFSVEEQWDRTLWSSYLGKRIKFNGVPDSLSAGDSITVRLVAIEFAAQLGTITATFMPLLTKYPSTPQNHKKKKAYTPAERIGWTEKGSQGYLKTSDGRTLYPSIRDELLNEFPDLGTGGGGGGEDGGASTGNTPSPTNPYAGVDGVLTPDDLKGSEGYNPWETPVEYGVNSYFSEFKETYLEAEPFDGVIPVDVRSFTQTETNRLYGVDHLWNGWGTSYGYTGTVTDFNGGIDGQTGKKKTPYLPIIITKTSMKPDGNGLAPIEKVGEISAATVESCMPEYEWNESYAGQNYDVRGTYAVTNWYVNGRYYVAIGASFYSQRLSSTSSEPIVNSGSSWRPYYHNGKITVFSTAINIADGKFSGTWKKEPWKFEHDMIPAPWNISRRGNMVVFGVGSPCLQVKIKNLTSPQFNASYMLNGTTFYGAEKPERNGHTRVPVYREAIRASLNLITGERGVTSYMWNGGFGDNVFSATRTNIFMIFDKESPAQNYFSGRPESVAQAPTVVSDAKKSSSPMTVPTSFIRDTFITGIYFHGAETTSEGIQKNPHYVLNSVTDPADDYWGDQSWVGETTPIRGLLYSVWNGGHTPNGVFKINNETRQAEHLQTITQEPYKSFAWGDASGWDSPLRWYFQGPFPIPRTYSYQDYQLFFRSRVYSYGGRLFVFKNGLVGPNSKHGITVRSMKLINA